MKHAILFAAAAACALSLAACQKKAEAPNPADAGTSNAAVNSAQDTTAAAVGTASATTAAATNSTDAFVTGLVTSGMYEIDAGKIASTKATNPAVKAFGKMMVADHTAMSKEMAPIIAAANQKPSPDLDQRRKGLLDNLKGAPADRFDKEYLDQQEAAHKEALTLMQGYADQGSDAGLKAAAAKAIPKVQAHLDKVHELQQGAAAAPPAKK